MLRVPWGTLNFYLFEKEKTSEFAKFQGFQ